MIAETTKKGRFLGLFLIGCLLFNYPILSLFNLDIMVFGIPLLYFYLFTVWITLIILMIRVSASQTDRHSSDQDQASC
jgi:hypothetical protein